MEDKILKILESINMDYLLEGGKNSSSEVVAVCCPFCGDVSYHGGFFKSSGSYNCFRCSTKGSLYKIVSELIGKEDTKNLFVEVGIFEPSFGNKSIEDSLNLLNTFYNNNSSLAKYAIDYRSKRTSEDIIERIMPEGLISIGTSKKALKYLVEERKIGKEYLAELMNIYHPNTDSSNLKGYGTYRIEDLKDRIYFPLYYKGEIKTWIARDITSKASKRYLAPKLTFNKSLIAPTSLVYPFDFCMNFHYREILLVQEGVFDTIPINLLAKKTGMTSVSLNTNVISNNQSKMLKELSVKYKKIVLMLDKSEALNVPMWTLELINKGITNVSYIIQTNYKDSGSVPSNKYSSYIEELHKLIHNIKEI